MAEHPSLEAMVRELWDREQIRQVKYRNMRHLDLKQWDEMAQTFTEDCTTSWVNGQIALRGRDAIMQFLRSTDFARGDLVVHVHQVAAMEIEFTGPDEARAVSRLYNPMHHREADLRHLLLAFYHDRFRRQDGQWKICHTGHEHLLEEMHEWRDIPSHKMLFRHAF
jgi:hypothetical protein